MTTDTALAVIDHDEIIDAHHNASALVLPVADPQALVHAMRQYQATKNAILEQSDFQSAGKTSFVKKSGWAKLAIAFGVSSRITDRRYDRDVNGDLIRAELIVTAEAPNGRFAEGLGVCHIGEERFTHTKDHPKGWWKAGEPNNRDKIEHDLPATAETRARNRAYSALFGHGEVSWEEVDAGGGATSWDQEPASNTYRSDLPKASPNKPASANQLATAAKLSRLLGKGEIPEDMTSAEASDLITDLSREYNERKSAPRGRQASRDDWKNLMPPKEEAAAPDAPEEAVTDDSLSF